MDPDLNQLAKAIHSALKAWRADRYDGSDLRHLALIRKEVRSGKSEGAATFALLKRALEALNGYAPEQARLLRERFEEGKKMEAIESDWSSSSLYNQQRDAIAELAVIVNRWEKALREERQSLIDRDLESTSTVPPIGAGSKIARLLPRFDRERAPWMIALMGIGGIGKTTLADALVRQLVFDGSIERILWVSAKQETLSLTGQIKPVADAPTLTLDALFDFLALRLLGTHAEEWHVPEYQQVRVIRAHLGEAPHLLVLDNLETTPNIEALLPTLKKLANPTRILLTSRVRLPDEGEIFHYPVPALTVEETHALLLQEAQVRGIECLEGCDRKTAERIYAVVGGNPLAIRIAAGQIGIHGVEAVLDDLQHAGGTGERLHRYLFEWSWEHLPDAYRRLLLALVMIPANGGDLAQVSRITELPVAEIRPGLEELVRLNLVEVRPHLAKPRYSIHNLTRTFLLETVHP